MRVFHFGDDGGVEIVCFRSWACGRTVHHVQASLILETHPFWWQGCLAMTWGHVRPWAPASPRVPCCPASSGPTPIALTPVPSLGPLPRSHSFPRAPNNSASNQVSISDTSEWPHHFPPATGLPRRRWLPSQTPHRFTQPAHAEPVAIPYFPTTDRRCARAKHRGAPAGSAGNTRSRKA